MTIVRVMSLTPILGMDFLKMSFQFRLKTFSYIEHVSIHTMIKLFNNQNQLNPIYSRWLQKPQQMQWFVDNQHGQRLTHFIFISGMPGQVSEGSCDRALLQVAVGVF